MLNEIKDWLMPHPAALILLWACLVIFVQSLPITELLLVGLLLLIAAYALAAARLVTLLCRTRWIMLSMLLIYVYATPGEAIWTALGQFSPTHEGLTNGLLQLGRLVFTLASLAILLNLLSRHQFISGLYILMYPLGYIGLPRERIIVRLALTLQYAESVTRDTQANWRSSITQLLAPVDVKLYSIELHIIPLTIRDGMLLTIGCALLVLALL